MKKLTIKKHTKLTKEQEEKLQILAKSDEIKGKQLVITDEGIESEDELKSIALETSDNPKKKYDLHYNGISRLLTKHLPKGREHKKARDLIYEEKNTYLTRGNRKKKDGTRGADSRMGYINDHDEILNLIISWIRSNGSMVDLYNSLRDLNKTKGYVTE